MRYGVEGSGTPVARWAGELTPAVIDDIEIVRTDAMMWESAGLLYGFKGFRFNGSGYHVSSTLEKVIRCHYDGRNKGALETDLNDDEHQLLDAFYAAGLVHSVDCSGEPVCSLTDAGRQTLCFVHHLASPSPCLDIRPDVALEDRTTYELLLLLRDEGWQWARLPDKPEDRVDLSYTVGAQKIWYSRTLGENTTNISVRGGRAVLQCTWVRV